MRRTPQVLALACAAVLVALWAAPAETPEGLADQNRQFGTNVGVAAGKLGWAIFRAVGASSIPSIAPLSASSGLPQGEAQALASILTTYNRRSALVPGRVSAHAFRF